MYKYQLFVDDKTIYQLLQTSRISLNLEFFYVRNSFDYFQICPTLALVLHKGTSTNCLWMTKPYTNCWQTSRISLNLDFFHVRNSFNYFLIWLTFNPVLPNVQVPIVCGWQNHIPSLPRVGILFCHPQTIGTCTYLQKNKG